MPDDYGDKSQEATPHRRQKAREEGRIPRSQDLTSSLLMLAGVLLLMGYGGRLGNALLVVAERQLAGEAWLYADIEFTVTELYRLATRLGLVLAPFLGMILGAAIGAQLIQVGWVFVPKRVALDFNRVNPMKGLARLVSLPNFMRLGFGMLKVLLLVGLGAWMFWLERDAVLLLATRPVADLLPQLVHVATSICLKLSGALVGLALLDYLFQRWKHEQDLRMTPQEVREELRTLQGDPQVQARRRQTQRQLAVNRLDQIMRDATAVLKNPTELAIAIKYDQEEMPAPIVIAKGAGMIAQRIRDLAEEYGVPVVERRELARALYRRVEVNEPIPPEHYAAVAEVLHYIYELDGRDAA